MKVLALNCGSSSLKFQIVEIENGGNTSYQALIRGQVRIGANGALHARSLDGRATDMELAASKHAEAASCLLRWLDRQGEVGSRSLDAVGHRVAHGGEEFTKAVLGGADAILFGGGIGENAPAVRQRICSNLDWFGLHLDQTRNAASQGQEAQISTDDSAISVYVVPVNEEALIARDTFECLTERRIPANH